ncbi:MAG TPA: DAK2 domain-containing protein [Solirubrobacteraceae bacterium]|nr:DAK2 domain-containing protein [Solirubrobacteraceae bacterium]
MTQTAVTDTNLLRFRAAVAGALAHLESRRQEVNDLNVFPVADGDTGDNMVLTLRAVIAELDRLQGTDARRTVDEIGREEIVQSVARAALLGARGNSGVILSQLIRGAAEELVARPGELVDTTVVAAALANAAERAYGSVRNPAEGTILTVAREMAQRLADDVQREQERARLAPETPPEAQDRAIAQALERAVAAGQESVKRGPELLAALRDAGVVDAGGYGLTILFAGVVAALRGEDPPPLDHYEPARIHHPEHSSGTYRYCTNFAVTGSELQPAHFIAPLEALGDSVLVVGDESTLKVHVHTDEPERATAVFAGAGEVSHLDVADMRAQVAERDGRLGGAISQADGTRAADGPAPPSERLAALNGDVPTPDGDAPTPDGAAPAPVAPPVAARATAPDAVRCGAVAVVSGAGLQAMFAELGVHTIDGGPTLNPSTYELLAAIHEVPAEEVVVLPNSANVIMAAERAAELSDKQVLVVPATSQQAGLAAALALVPERAVEQNAQALHEALARLRTGAVAPAAREDVHGRFSRGEAVGFLDDEVIAWGEPAVTLRAVLAELADGAELLSVLSGQDAPLAEHTVAGLLDGELGDTELELRHGGQPAYWWLLSAE